jgi:glutamate-1-semialdehyde 2,1-aminomutase
VVIPFNEEDRAVAILEAHKNDIAGVVVDLLPHRVGLIPAEQNYVDTLRKWATANGALLIIDEVITFRTEYAGAQEAYGLKSDLTAMGKMIGGGFPVGAIAGRTEVMEVMNPLNGPALFPLYGTFSANPVTLTAGLVAMNLFSKAAVANLNALADRARAGIAEAISLADVPACVTGRGSMFRIHLKETAPKSYRTAFVGPQEQERATALLDYLCENGLIMIETCSGALSTPMNQTEIDCLCEVVLGGLRAIKSMF